MTGPQDAVFSRLRTITEADLMTRARALAVRGHRVILGITGAPGAGKSHLAERITDELGPALACYLPMDGFHLAGEVLERLGRTDRKGAPDTFDASGYIALLRRVHGQPGRGPGPDPAPAADRLRADHPRRDDDLHDVVFAPRFRREIEEPIASAIPIGPAVPLVVTEGNYLLFEDDPWWQVRGLLDEVWYLAPPEDLRRARLVQRHERHGRSPSQARERALGSDEANARAIAATSGRADAIWRTE